MGLNCTSKVCQESAPGNAEKCKDKSYAPPCYAIKHAFIILLDGKARFLVLPSKLESEEKDANKTSKKADKVKTGEMLGDNSQSSHSHNREQWKRKLQSGRVWLHPQPWPERRGEKPLSAGYLG